MPSVWIPQPCPEIQRTTRLPVKAYNRSLGNSVKPVKKWSYNNLQKPCMSQCRRMSKLMASHTLCSCFPLWPNHTIQFTIHTALSQNQRNFKHQKDAADLVPGVVTPSSRQVWWIDQQQTSDVSPLVALLWTWCGMRQDMWRGPQAGNSLIKKTSSYRLQKSTYQTIFPTDWWVVKGFQYIHILGRLNTGCFSINACKHLWMQTCGQVFASHKRQEHTLSLLCKQTSNICILWILTGVTRTSQKPRCRIRCESHANQKHLVCRYPSSQAWYGVPANHWRFMININLIWFQNVIVALHSFEGSVWFMLAIHIST